MDGFELIHLLRRVAGLSHRQMMPGSEMKKRLPREQCGSPFYHGEGHMPPPHGSGGNGGPHRERERILSLLDEAEKINQQKLALILEIRPQSLSELLGKLEKDGLIRREKGEEDRRETLVSLTPEGRERARSFEEERNRAYERFLAPLSEEERIRLQQLLEKLLQNECGNSREEYR